MGRYWFDALIGAVNTGKGDMVAAGLSPNEERKRVQNYQILTIMQARYYELCINFKRWRYQRNKRYQRKKVGVQLSTIQESTVNEIKDEYELKVDSRQNYAQMVQEIKNKRIDFIVVEKAVADEYVEKMMI